VPRVPTALLRRVLLATAMVLSLLVPAVAHASYQELLKDACRDGKVNGTYSQKDYRDALANLPSDALQYTDCRSVLLAAQRAAAAAQSAGAGAAASAFVPASGGDPLANATPAERAAVGQAVHRAAVTAGRPIKVGGVTLDPAALGAGRPVSASISGLPTPLLIALGLLSVAALVAIGLVIVPRVRDRRQP
jgi:hypothetical protein